MPTNTQAEEKVDKLLTNSSFEITARDVDSFIKALDLVEPQTKVSITYLGNETDDQRVHAAETVLAHNSIPVPHIAARRIESVAKLDDYLSRLKMIGAAKKLLIIGGDPSEPMGPFDSALSIIKSGSLEKFGVEAVGIAGYPEGHPDIANNILWKALDDKIALLRQLGMTAEINTQFSFDVDAVVNWIEKVRDRGITESIRIGVPGPAGIKRLLAFASRFGIGSNAMILKKYGLSLSNLMGTAGPTKFIEQLQKAVNSKGTLGDVTIHFYTFGGVTATAEWIKNNSPAK